MWVAISGVSARLERGNQTHSHHIYQKLLAVFGGRAKDDHRKAENRLEIERTAKTVRSKAKPRLKSEFKARESVRP